MEEIEISSWLTLDAIKKRARVVETVGNLQTGHGMSVFAVIEDDFLELAYGDSGSNYLRRFEDRDDLDQAIDQRKEEDGEVAYEEDEGDYDEDGEDEEEEDIEAEDESDSF